MDNQTLLLDQTLILFSQRGYEAVGVQDIVLAAGLTKPTLYHYFGSKRGLLESLLEREAAPLVESVTQAAVYEGDLVRSLENTARAYFQQAIDSHQFYRMSLAMQVAPPESESYRAIQPYARKQQLAIEELFFQAAEDHGNMRGRHQRYAASFLGQINAWVRLSLQGEWDLDDQAVYQLMHQFMHGIFS